MALIQQIAMIGIISSIFFFFKILPPRPKRYRAWRTVGLILQWALAPVSAIIYGSAASLYSQVRLMTGRYLIKFDVTDKNTVRTDN